MFIPVLIFGFPGARVSSLVQRDSSPRAGDALVTVISGSRCICSADRVKTGTTITMMVYLGGLAYLVDQWLLMRRAQQQDTGIIDPLLPAAE